MPEATAVAQALSRIDQLIQAGRLDLAESHCRELVQLAPENPESWLRLGNVLLRRTGPFEAELALRRAGQLEPKSAAIWNQLSSALCRQGRGAEAEECARRALEVEATNADCWAVLGNALAKQYQWSKAATALRQSLALNPNQAAAWNNLGNAELKSGRLDAAKVALGRALALSPGNIEPIANYAFLLCRMDQRQAADQWIQSALIRQPLAPESWLFLGELWQRMVEWELAENAYRRALQLAPQFAAAEYQLARVLRSRRQYAQAEQTLRNLIAREPNHADAWALLGEVVSLQGRSDVGTQIFQKAVEIAPSDDRYGRWLLNLQYDEASTPQSLLKTHRQWNEALAQQLTPDLLPSPIHHSASRPLRIGFVSSDFGQHPTAFLVLPALAHLDRASCTVVCYSDRAFEDDYTARFRKAASEWRVIFGQSDDNVATLIRNDNIDVLVDLMGHTGKRMLVFARKPATMQVTWFGYVGTTGLTAMDYLLADRFHVREGEELNYSEKILRMPNGYACYEPPSEVPEVEPLPALCGSPFTFGCFNNVAKYSPSLVEAWMTILQRLPVARLFLKSGSFDDPGVRQKWQQWFASRGISEDRIVIEGWSSQCDLLASYNRVDLALDSQPYSGGLTTCEALWMGVPVVTFPGKTFASRHSTSYMTNAGYEQFIAADLAGYGELAIAWGHRIDELARLRAEMRSRIKSSPLCDAARFARDFSQLLQDAWRVQQAKT